MPYAPGIQYRGDQYLYQAFSGLGEQVGGAIRDYRHTQDESRAADETYGIFRTGAEALARTGRLDPKVIEELESMEKFSGQSLRAKKAKIGQLGVSFKMLLDENAKAEEAKARAALETYRNRTLDQQDARESRESAMRRETFDMLLNAATPALREAGKNHPNANPDAFLRLLEEDARRAERASPKHLHDPAELVAPFEAGGVRGAVNRLTGAMVLQDGEGAVKPRKGLQGRLSRNPLTAEEELTITGELDAMLEQYPELKSKIPGAPNPARPSPAYPKGKRVFQGGHVYEYDGKNWNPVN